MYDIVILQEQVPLFVPVGRTKLSLLNMLYSVGNRDRGKKSCITFYRVNVMKQENEYKVSIRYRNTVVDTFLLFDHFSDAF